MEQKQKCWKCKEDKPLNNVFFNKDSNQRNGFQKACKECQKKITAAYREKNKDYFAKKNKDNYKKENNSERYNKYKEQYLERRKNFSKSIRGRLYDLLESARGRAVKKNIPIDIDLEYLIDLYEVQNGKCKLTNLDFTFNTRDKKHFNPFNPSIDKIDSNKGYTKDNVRLVCVIVNLSLNQFGEGTFALMCEAYINTSKNKGEATKPLPSDL